MAGYVTKQELIDRFGEATLADLTDRGDSEPGVIDDAVLDRAIDDAGAVVDGYLKVRYSLPLAAVPALLKPLAEDMIFYRLHVHGAPEEARNRYIAAIRQLEGLSKGTLKLDVAGAEPDAPGESPKVSGPERMFSRDTLESF